jgi:uncharacterized glyoxalase superfamily protein PhnB
VTTGVRISPYLFYENAEAAADFLQRAFGFEEQERAIGGAGRLHVTLTLGDATLMLGQGGDDYRNPSNAGQATAMIHVYLDGDVEEHRERARAAGAQILTELAEQPNGDRRYDAVDPEGHMWSFAVAG